MEILKNQSIVLQFVNFGKERERDKDDSSLFLPPYLFLNIIIILRNNNRILEMWKFQNKNRPNIIQFIILEGDKNDSFLSLIILRNNNRSIFI